MTAAIEPRADLPALTGIRGLAAWFVVLFHIRSGATSQLPPELMQVLDKGYLAVDLFFMLSGFVLWLNYGERLRARGPSAIPSFIARRIARIWPLHLFMLGCAAAFALLLMLTGRSDPESYRWGELPLHILLMQNWGFTDTLRWNEPAWSISCEFAAYLLFPLLVLTADWRRYPALVLVLAIGGLALLLHLLMTAGGAADLGSDIPRFGLPRALAEFAIGTILCALWMRWRASPRLPGSMAGMSALLLGLASARGLVPETFGVPLALAALLLGLALAPATRGNPFAWRWVHYLGQISYSTYLVHFLLYIAFKLVFVGDPSDVPLSLLALFLLLVLVASVALHHMIERPAQRRLNRAFDSLRSPRPFAPEGA